MTVFVEVPGLTDRSVNLSNVFEVSIQRHYTTKAVEDVTIYCFTLDQENTFSRIRLTGRAAVAFASFWSGEAKMGKDYIMSHPGHIESGITKYRLFLPAQKRAASNEKPHQEKLDEIIGLAKNASDQIRLGNLGTAQERMRRIRLICAPENQD